IEQETRRYDEKSKKTVLMRVKGSADDYRFFTDPDIVPLYIDEAWKEKIRAEIPELPDARMSRYIEELDLSAYDAGVITSTKEMADFFEKTVNLNADAKQAANWLMSDLSGIFNKQGLGLNDLRCY